jgi:AcrR family transcriptional regulator
MPSLNEGDGARRVSVTRNEETVSNSPAGTVTDGARVDGKVRQGAHVIEMQRRRLLAAMVEVLDENGYEGATVGRICKRAGVSRRTFYDLYEDREGCFLDTLDSAIERLSEKVAPIFAITPNAGKASRAKAPRSWRARVRGALTVLLECFDAEPGLARLCIVETLKGGPEILERRRAVVEGLTVAVDEGRREAKGADPPPLTAEGLVGGVASLIHARLLADTPPAAGGSATKRLQERSSATRKPGKPGVSRMVELLNPSMSMIVLPYLGPVPARKELEHPLPPAGIGLHGSGHAPIPAAEPFKDLPIRLTFRTARVLTTIGSQPNASNRDVAQSAGVTDQGQMSKLLQRLEKAGLIDNHGQGQIRGEANAWRLTPQGQGLLHAVSGDDG